MRPSRSCDRDRRTKKMKGGNHQTNYPRTRAPKSPHHATRTRVHVTYSPHSRVPAIFTQRYLDRQDHRSRAQRHKTHAQQGPDTTAVLHSTKDRSRLPARDSLSHVRREALRRRNRRDNVVDTSSHASSNSATFAPSHDQHKRKRVAEGTIGPSEGCDTHIFKKRREGKKAPDVANGMYATVRYGNFIIVLLSFALTAYFIEKTRVYPRRKGVVLYFLRFK